VGERSAALAAALAQLADDVDRRVEATHLAIADRTFRNLGPLGLPVRPLHDGLARLVHTCVRTGLAGGGRGVVGLLRHVDAADRALEGPSGITVVGAVAGARGPTLRETVAGPDWPTQLRRMDGRVLATLDAQGQVVVLDPPAAGPRVVLLHGLCETELSWWQLVPAGARTIPDALADVGAEVLLVRTDTGRRVAESGTDVARLLEALSDDGGPLVLVGHSMGGLVARAALRAGARAGHGWVGATQHLVTLGAPHAGAPLEQAVELLVRMGERVPEVAALVGFLGLRSDGIRDLRHGADDDVLAAGERAAPAPVPGHVVLHTVAATLAGRVRPQLFGDGLVRPASAHGTSRRGALDARRGTVLDLPDSSHFDLLAAPEVLALVTGLLGARASA